MNPQTPDNEVARKALDACRDYRKALSEKTNEVARLKAGLDVMSKLYEEERADRIKATNEVARLRELLDRAIEIARVLRKLAFIDSEDYCDWHFEDRSKAANDFADLCKEVNRLATAPEEPQDGGTHAWRCPHCLTMWEGNYIPKGFQCPQCNRAK